MCVTPALPALPPTPETHRNSGRMPQSRLWGTVSVDQPGRQFSRPPALSSPSPFQPSASQQVLVPLIPQTQESRAPAGRTPPPPLHHPAQADLATVES